MCCVSRVVTRNHGIPIHNLFALVFLRNRHFWRAMPGGPDAGGSPPRRALSFKKKKRTRKKKENRKERGEKQKEVKKKEKENGAKECIV